MHPLAKIIVGFVLLAGSVWWVWQGSLQTIGRPGLEDFVSVLNGVIPPLVFLLGLFVIWLELDELKLERI